MNPEEKDVKENETGASQDQVEETVQTVESTQDVDYKAELEAAQAALAKKTKQIGQAEHVIEKLKSGDGQEDVSEVVARLVEEKVGALETKFRADTLEQKVQSSASSNDEAELIKFHLENTIKRSGDDAKDIQVAKAIANAKRMSQQSAEANRAELQTDAKPATSAGQKTEPAQNKKWSAAEKEMLRKYGVEV